MINQRLQNAINKIIDKKFDEFRNYSDIVEYIRELLDLPLLEVLEGVFIHLINKDINPLDELDYDLSEYFYGDSIISLLTNSGWFDKYFKNPKEFPVNFQDITIEGDRIYMYCDEWKDLNVLFELDDRNLVEDILDPDWSEIFGYIDVSFENDVTEVLSNKAIAHIVDYIKENDFIGKEIYTLDEEYGDILTEELLEDKHTLFHLIDEEEMFNELKSELKSMYRWSYNSASESELFKEIKDTITSFLGSEGEWYDVKKGDKTTQLLKFDVSNIFYTYLKLYIEVTAKFPAEHENYFLDVLSGVLIEQDDELTGPRVDYFYPNSNLVEEDMTEHVISNL